MRKGLTIFALAALTALFLWAVSQVLALRFDQGDVYPPHSSFRSDPLGTRVLYESLERLSETSVERSVLPIETQEPPAGACLLQIDLPWGLYWGGDDEDEEAIPPAIKKFVEAGGRFVGSVRESSFRRPVDDDMEALHEEGEHETPHDRFWNFGLRVKPMEEDSGTGDEEAIVAFPELNWKSGWSFADVGEEWEVLQEEAGQPVIVQQKLGEGILVLLAGSYALSNEAMHEGQSPRFLSFLFGSANTVVFDESVHGVVQYRGVAFLVGRYGLFPAFLSIGVLGALLLWKNAVPLVPEIVQRGRKARQAQHASLLKNLAARAVPLKDANAVALREWQQAAEAGLFGGRRPPAEVMDQLKQMTSDPDSQKEPVKTYNRITEKLRSHGNRAR